MFGCQPAAVTPEYSPTATIGLRNTATLVVPVQTEVPIITNTATIGPTASIIHMGISEVRVTATPERCGKTVLAIGGTLTIANLFEFARGAGIKSLFSCEAQTRIVGLGGAKTTQVISEMRQQRLINAVTTDFVTYTGYNNLKDAVTDGKSMELSLDEATSELADEMHFVKEASQGGAKTYVILLVTPPEATERLAGAVNKYNQRIVADQARLGIDEIIDVRSRFVNEAGGVNTSLFKEDEVHMTNWALENIFIPQILVQINPGYRPISPFPTLTMTPTNR